jgi:deoxyhypusine synthase
MRPRIRGSDFDLPIGLDGLLESYASIGFQASGLNKAIEIINRMVCIPPPFSTPLPSGVFLAYLALCQTSP